MKGDVEKIERELARLFKRVDKALPRILRNCHKIMNLLIDLRVFEGPSYMPGLSQGMVFFEWFTLYRYKGGRLYKARGDVPIDRAVHLDVTLTVYLMRHNPITLEVGLERTAEGVEPFKVELLEDTDFHSVMIFTRTKRRARFLARDLEKKGYRVSALQGNMSQNKRQRSINGFRDGQYDILVATDVAARGIDVTDITHVINFDMPDTVDAYTHRIGRTGRVDQSGDAFTFTEPDDEAMVRSIERLLGKRIERRKLPDFDYSAPKPRNQGRPQQAPSNQQRGRRRNQISRGQANRSTKPSRQHQRQRNTASGR